MQATNKKQFSYTETQVEDYPGYLLWQISNQWQRAVTSVLKDFDLTPVQFLILSRLDCLMSSGVCVSQCALAKSANLNTMMTSDVLRALEKKVLVERRINSNDTRAFTIVLNKNGQNLLNQTKQLVMETDLSFFQILGTNQEELINLLQILHQPKINA